jgi:dihydroorotate dehydrogenase
MKKTPKTKKGTPEYKAQRMANIKGGLKGFAAHPENINRTGLNRKKVPTLHHLLTKITPDQYEEVIRALVTKAVKGDVMAINSLLDRMFGKPHQSIATKNMNVDMSLSDYLEKLSGEPLKAALKQLGDVEPENNNDNGE